MKKITVETIAAQCHEANRTLCIQQGDFSQVNWEIAPEWQRDSAMKGVQAHVDSGLTMTPEDSHASWMKEKEEQGWVYGEVKNPEAKTHPCMVAYEELPLHQRLKDHLFRAIVHVMAPHLGK